jgi:integrase
MPAQKRHPTGYPGVYYIVSRPGTPKEDKIYYIDYRNKDGIRIQEKAGFSSKGMTPAQANNIRSDRQRGKELSNKERRRAEQKKKREKENRWTVDRLWTEYKAGRNPGKGLSTDSCRYEKYLKSEFGHFEPFQILPLDVERLKRRLLKEKSPQTVKHVLNLLTWIVNFGVKNSLCQGLSFHVSKPTVANEKTEDLSHEQLKKLLETIKKDNHAQAGKLMLMALYSGMRRNEMFKLQWSHIDYHRGFITLVDPKGGRDQQIPLNDPTRKLLKGISRKKGSPYVFPGRSGSQRVDINKALAKIKKNAGLPKNFRALHGLRHVYASILASSGLVDIYTLQKLLTHKDPRMTQRYAHLRDEALKKAAAVAGDVISELSATKKKPASKPSRINKR